MKIAERFIYQYFKITREAFQDKDTVRSMLGDAEKKITEAGGKMDIYYFTFRNSDFQTDWITAEAFSDTYPYSYVKLTAPEEKMKEAISWVMENNGHLSFTGVPVVGIEGDDFEKNRLTAAIYFMRNK